MYHTMCIFFYGIFYDRTLFLHRDKRNNVFISQDYDLFIFTVSQFYLNVFGLDKPAILINHKTSMVVDPGGEWEEDRVGGVVVVGGDGCRPRGVGGGER